MKRKYMQQWWGRFVQFLEATQAIHREMIEAIVDVIEKLEERLGFSIWLWRFLPVDLGLHLLALATRLMR